MNLRETLNYYGSKRIPFFFCISYDKTQWDVTTLNTLDDTIQYALHTPSSKKKISQPHSSFIDFNTYSKQFNKVIDNIKAGNTYLLNLTASTDITCNNSLQEIYSNTNAKYKLFYKNKFVSFSPETFITIQNNTIASYPMKGTIDANIKDAKELILNDKKELAEHIMIVDLLRNDLNLVAKNVKVDTFRYIDKIFAGDKELLQVSSQISGTLEENWHNTIGDIILPLLPAGSISGTPKKKTLELIDAIESHKRDFFTGVWGVYDGKSIDSSVLIRFIEKNEKQNESNKYIYKSGGGITLDSNVFNEYKELQSKVYFPQ